MSAGCLMISHLQESFAARCPGVAISLHALTLKHRGPLSSATPPGDRGKYFQNHSTRASDTPIATSMESLLDRIIDN